MRESWFAAFNTRTPAAAIVIRLDNVLHSVRIVFRYGSTLAIAFVVVKKTGHWATSA